MLSCAQSPISFRLRGVVVQTLLKTCDVLAEQHDHVASALADEVCEPMRTLLRDKEAARTQVYSEIARQNNAHDKERDTLTKVEIGCGDW